MSFVNEYDVHKWTFGFEKGKKGYKHIQARVLLSNETYEGENFDKIKNWFASAGNIQKCSESWDYECKEGRFLSWMDDDRIRRQRFYPLKEWQKEAIDDLMKQNDRQVDFYYDPKGGHGKSHLATHLMETGKAIRVLMNVGIEDYLKTIASEYIRQPRKIIAIDVPRSRLEGKSDKERAGILTKLNEVLECLKDGVVGDPRYNSRVVNMGDVKVIVFSNYDIPAEGGLSFDRYRAWRLASTTEDDFKTVKRETVRVKYRG